MLLIDTNYDDLIDLGNIHVTSDSDIDKYMFLLNYIESIRNLDIKSFHLLLFKENFLSLSDDEFNELYNVLIENVLEQNPLDFKLILNNPLDLKFTKMDFINFIDFYMNLFPYTYLKNMVAKFDSLPAFVQYYTNEETPLRSAIITEIKNSVTKNDRFQSLVAGLGGNISSAKNRDKYNSIIKLLSQSIHNKNNIFMKYIDMISEIDRDDLEEYITLCLEKDIQNIAPQFS
jgi:hypothetical protein